MEQIVNQGGKYYAIKTRVVAHSTTVIDLNMRRPFVIIGLAHADAVSRFTADATWALFNAAGNIRMGLEAEAVRSYINLPLSNERIDILGLCSPPGDYSVRSTSGGGVANFHVGQPLAVGNNRCLIWLELID